MLTRYLPVLFSLLSLLGLDAPSPEQKEQMFFQSHVSIMARSERAVDNLYKLCKIWGYLKYKHPEITRGNLDWDLQLLTYLGLTDSLSFETLLLAQLPKIERHQVGDTTNRGPEWVSRNKLLSEEMQKYLPSASTFELLEEQQYVEPGRWNIAPNFKEKKYPNITYGDDGVKLLSLFRYWNIIEYFFPYKDLMDKDWDTILMEYIPKVLASGNELEFKLVLLQLVCEINDGHEGIHNDETLNEYLGKNQIPIELKIIEHKAYVKRLFDTNLPLEVGDRVLKINGEEIHVLLDVKRPYVPASTSSAKGRMLSEYILRTNKDTPWVQVLRNKRELQLALPTKKYNPLQYVQRSIPSNREISDDIAYIYPGALKHSELDSLLMKYENKASIIFDYRSYPTVNIQGILPNFLLPFPRHAFKSKQYSKNDLGEFTFAKSTAGTIGNWTPIYLPGNILTSISGNGIFRYDESPVQRIGIVPDIYLEPTVEGIEKNKDEILEAAIEYCQKK